MQEIPFIKMHGLGNCYVYVDCFAHSLREADLSNIAIAVSDVNKGIGSDGMILIGPSSKAAVKMRIFNKDGSEGKNCGNGLRCVAKYAYEKGYVKNNAFPIETLSGIVHAEVQINAANEPNKFNTSNVFINMGKPILDRENVPMLGKKSNMVVNEPFDISGQNLLLTAVSMGNPHAVFFVSDISNAPYKTLGPIIECDPRFPEKINVEFIEIESPTSIHCRVWERGSGVTQACGTGACAVAVAAILTGRSQKETDIAVHLEGGTLTIRWQNNGEILMKGPATTIATGKLFLTN